MTAINGPLKSMGAIVSRKNRLSKQDTEFLTYATKYSPDQVKEWFRYFQNNSNDGAMTKLQFLTVYQELFPEIWQTRANDESAGRFLKLLFDTFDLNKNGVWDFKEFVLFVNMVKDGTQEEKLKASFQIFDQDRGGSITQVELFKVIKSLMLMQSGTVEGTATTCSEVMKRLDRDGNGKVTMKEFVTACKADDKLMQFLVENKSVVTWYN